MLYLSKSEKEWSELQNFLEKNYVEDKYATMRFDYTVPFLKWALLVPDYLKDLFIFIKQNENIVGFIAGIPTKEIF